MSDEVTALAQWLHGEATNRASHLSKRDWVEFCEQLSALLDSDAEAAREELEDED